MSRRRISIETIMNCGFKCITERYLLNTIVADGFEQFRNVKELFVPVMRASKLHNIDYRSMTIYGAGPHIETYGDLIQQVTTLDFIIRYKLGKVVGGVYDRGGWNMQALPAEFLEQVLIQDENGDQSEVVISPEAKNIIDRLFEGHILCMYSE